MVLLLQLQGLEFNHGAPAGLPAVSDIGLDVVMREAYGGGGPGGLGKSPAAKGVIRRRESRYYPMTFAASWDMPAPEGCKRPVDLHAHCQIWIRMDHGSAWISGLIWAYCFVWVFQT